MTDRKETSEPPELLPAHAPCRDAHMGSDGTLCLNWRRRDRSAGLLLIITPESATYSIRDEDHPNYATNGVEFDLSKGWPEPMIKFLAGGDTDG